MALEEVKKKVEKKKGKPPQLKYLAAPGNANRSAAAATNTSAGAAATANRSAAAAYENIEQSEEEENADQFEGAAAATSEQLQWSPLFVFLDYDPKNDVDKINYKHFNDFFSDKSLRTDSRIQKFKSYLQNKTNVIRHHSSVRKSLKQTYIVGNKAKNQTNMSNLNGPDYKQHELNEAIESFIAKFSDFVLRKHNCDLAIAYSHKRLRELKHTNTNTNTNKNTNNKRHFQRSYIDMFNALLFFDNNNDYLESIKRNVKARKFIIRIIDAANYEIYKRKIKNINTDPKYINIVILHESPGEGFATDNNQLIEEYNENTYLFYAGCQPHISCETDDFILCLISDYFVQSRAKVEIYSRDNFAFWDQIKRQSRDICTFIKDQPSFIELK